MESVKKSVKKLLAKVLESGLFFCCLIREPERAA